MTFNNNVANYDTVYVIYYALVYYTAFELLY